MLFRSTYDLDTAVQAEVYDTDGVNMYALQADESIKDATTVTYAGTGVEGTKVTVGANGTADITVTIAVDKENEQIKGYIENYKNGFFVEGYTFAKGSNTETVSLSVPFLGFMGNWGDADMFDYSGYGDVMPVFNGCVVSNPKATTNANAQYGGNIFEYLTAGSTTYNADQIAMSTTSTMALTDTLLPVTTLMRGAKNLTYTITDAAGKVVCDAEYTDVSKSFYYANGGFYATAEDMMEEPFMFTGVDQDGKALKEIGRAHV